MRVDNATGIATLDALNLRGRPGSGPHEIGLRATVDVVSAGISARQRFIDAKAPLMGWVKACSERTFEYDGVCTPCPANSLLVGTTGPALSACACNEDYFSEVKDGVMSCTRCPSRSTSPQNSTSFSACSCEAGTYLQAESSIGKNKTVAVCLVIPSCPSSEQYLNDTSADFQQYACEQCPPGGACGVDNAAWSNLGPLFGWWKIPKSDRAGNASWKATAAFVKCPYPPACLGAPNRALGNRFFSNEGADLAMVERGNTSSTFACATTLGFRNRSRLCHACNATSRRQSNDRCTKCPDDGQNWGLIVLGFFVTLLVLCFVVGGAIGDAGKQSLSSAVQKITLNYLQVAALALAFPFAGPPRWNLLSFRAPYRPSAKL